VPARSASLMLGHTKCLAILSDNSWPRMGVRSKDHTKETLMITKLTITASAIVLGMGMVRPMPF
jgi:hypothetical protein